MANTRHSLPVLYIKATNNYEVGYQMGYTFKHWVHDQVEKTKSFKTMQDFVKTEIGRKVFDGYLTAAKESYPEFIEEIKGIADGSEQDFDNIFLINLTSELLLYHCLDAPKDKEVEGCSDVYVNYEGSRIIGHNEDWNGECDNFVFLVDVTINHSNGNVGDSGNEQQAMQDMDTSIQQKLGQRNEHYVSFVIAGGLPNLTFAMNKHLVFTNNSLVPSTINEGAVPLAILTRALLKCRTVDECVDVLQNDKKGCAFGTNINIASIDTTNMWSLEVYTEKGQTMTSLHDVVHQTDLSQPGHYFHQNHYKHLQAAKERNILQGSKIRDARCCQLPPPGNITDVLTILGDTEDPTEQIYRIPGTKDYKRTSKTVATALFDITGQTLRVYRCNPKLGDPCLTIPFL